MPLISSLDARLYQGKPEIFICVYYLCFLFFSYLDVLLCMYEHYIFCLDNIIHCQRWKFWVPWGPWLPNTQLLIIRILKLHSHSQSIMKFGGNTVTRVKVLFWLSSERNIHLHSSLHQEVTNLGKQGSIKAKFYFQWHWCKSNETSLTLRELS